MVNEIESLLEKSEKTYDIKEYNGEIININDLEIEN